MGITALTGKDLKRVVLKVVPESYFVAFIFTFSIDISYREFHGTNQQKGHLSGI